MFTVVLAVLYEGLKTFREYLMCVSLQRSKDRERREKLKLPDISSDVDSKSPCSQSSDSSSELDKKGRW